MAASNKYAESAVVRTGDSEKWWCTVISDIMGDGRKLPPSVILKVKTLLKVSAEGVIV